MHLICMHYFFYIRYNHYIVAIYISCRNQSVYQNYNEHFNWLNYVWLLMTDFVKAVVSAILYKLKMLIGMPQNYSSVPKCVTHDVCFFSLQLLGEPCEIRFRANQSRGVFSIGTRRCGVMYSRSAYRRRTSSERGCTTTLDSWWPFRSCQHVTSNRLSTTWRRRRTPNSYSAWLTTSTVSGSTIRFLMSRPGVFSSRLSGQTTTSKVQK